MNSPAIPELDAADLALLRKCPMTFHEIRGAKPTKAHEAEVARIKRLWVQHYVHLRVVSNTEWTVRLKDKGRLAIGQPALGEVPAPCV